MNQGAALLVTDAETARPLGIPEDRWVHPLGGAGADEPTDPRTRAAYHRVPALDVTVREVQEVTGTTCATSTTQVELYSCFPAMPKLTRRRSAGTRPRRSRSPAASRSSAVPAATTSRTRSRRWSSALRADGGTGFVHGVGMFNTKHHALVLADRPRDDGSVPRASPRRRRAAPARDPPVPVVEDYSGTGDRRSPAP